MFRGEVLWSLLSSGFRASEKEEQKIRDMLKEESDYAIKINSVLTKISNGARFELVKSALKHELYNAKFNK